MSDAEDDFLAFIFDLDAARPRYFDPDGNPISLMQWANSFEHRGPDNNTLKQTRIGDAVVSTVWLGLDHSFGFGPPLYWETMIFGGEHDESQWQHPTREAAYAAHDQIVAALRDGNSPAWE